MHIITYLYYSLYIFTSIVWLFCYCCFSVSLSVSLLLILYSLFLFLLSLSLAQPVQSDNCPPLTLDLAKVSACWKDVFLYSCRQVLAHVGIAFSCWVLIILIQFHCRVWSRPTNKPWDHFVVFWRYINKIDLTSVLMVVINLKISLFHMKAMVAIKMSSVYHVFCDTLVWAIMGQRTLVK